MSDIGDRIRAETTIVEAVACTAEGEFSFDIRDKAVGWTLARGGWEDAETQFVKFILKPGDTVVDVGANLGWYSVVGARAVGPGGRVLAFEPIPENFRLLNANVARNGMQDRVLAFSCALFERDERLEFELSGNNFGDHRIRGATTGEPEYYGEAARESITVEARALDAVMDEAGLGHAPVKLLKIDTQGSEVAVLRGAQQTLPNVAFMVAEFWPYGLRRAGYSVEEFAAIITPHFGSFGRLRPPELKMQPMDGFRQDVLAPFDFSPGTPVGFSNYVFSK